MTRPDMTQEALPILELEHKCDMCLTGERNCCSSFDVCITEKEVERIVGIMPLAAEYVPHIVDEDGSLENVFDDTGDGLVSIETQDDGLCVFGYRKDGATLCSLHTVALELNIPLETVKPQVCILWPLSISDPPNEIVGVDQDAYEFHCNHKKKKTSQLSPEVADILQTLWGQTVVEEIENHAGNTTSSRNK